MLILKLCAVLPINVFAARRNKLKEVFIKSKVVPLYAMVALGGRGGIAPTHT
jgi:hypothetical protein